MSTFNVEGVYYRKDHPTKPYTTRLFKMCKSKSEARKYLKYAEEFPRGTCRIALHKSSARRGAQKVWEFVVQSTQKYLWEALLLRALWSERMAQISKKI